MDVTDNPMSVMLVALGAMCVVIYLIGWSKY